jgi:oxygen-dependent protoporphyrinogen oxidase
MPQYTLGHRQRIERIAGKLAEHPGLHLTGASYRGVGIPDCIASGWAVADSITAPVGAA